MDTSYLLTLARESIRARLEHTDVDIQAEDQGLDDNGASFVTLTKQGELRGCIGSIIAFRPLIDDVIANAQLAAFEDPRFPPLTLEELSEIQIEISILTKPQEIRYHSWEDLRQIIVPFEDGVILRLGSYQSTFLPQVWEQLPDFNQFFLALADKSGFRGDIFKEHPLIERYRVSKIKE